ncbi:hypothetical protein LSTR_LSTR006342 [Laodelphax striatellus]|uniref:Uncharacterized protein n=1 Tax=Laodelphax striatellus TaxID=195883 RepID=A0A482XEN4_LAOST|nr:hypothetical protein LSTR_LSTR006342 [Laodelphax striatellus]
MWSTLRPEGYIGLCLFFNGAVPVQDSGRTSFVKRVKKGSKFGHRELVWLSLNCTTDGRRGVEEVRTCIFM